MSDNQEKEKLYSFSVVFHGIPKEDAIEIRNKIFENYKPDIIKGWQRLNDIANILRHFTHYIAQASASVDYSAPDDFSTSSQSVLKDIQARSEYTLKIADDIAKGMGEFAKGENEQQMDKLIENLLDMMRKG